MGLAKRGTRRITVGGVAYRWVAAPDDGSIKLVAELADADGQRLEASFRYHDVCEPSGAGSLRVVGQRRSIRPGVVRAAIEAALSRGWQPGRAGRAAFRLPDADDLFPVGP